MARRRVSGGGMVLRDHAPIEISQFNGLWSRGDSFAVPLDHFQDCQNIRFVGNNAFATRYGVDPHQNVVGPLGNVVRMYNYITTGGSTLLVLTYDGTTGKIYHVVDSTTVYGPILTKTGMTDFAFVPFAGRAYISPFTTFTVGGLNIEKGMQNEFLYVYLGAGAAARKAAGATPAGTLAVSNGAAGHTDAGLHLFAVVGETDTGYLSAPVAFKDFVTSPALSVSFANIPLFVGAQWVKRHIVATKKLSTYNGDAQGQLYFFIPNATINDNTTATLSNISFYDADLLDDASHLMDNYAEIPAGAVLSVYHDRLVLAATYTDISLVLVSAQGEPEAIDQVDGLLIFPLDGNPVTNAQEMRDILYVTKRAKTGSWSDNNDVPSTWPFILVDQAIGAPVHGISTVIDSGSTSVDFLIMASYKGIILFNGIYILPELTFKIKDFWLGQDRDTFRYIQLLNDPIHSILYCVLPDRRLLIGDYANGMSPKSIRWAVWKFDFTINSVALVNIDTLVFGAQGRMP